MNEMRKLMETVRPLFEQAAITDSWFQDGFETYKKPAQERYEIADSDGTINTLEGPVSYKKGFYILTGPKGEKYPMPPEKFAELKDDHGDGIATPKKIAKVAKLADHNGSVATSWGETLNYTAGKDYIVRHGAGDYGVVKADIFAKTYHLEENSQVTEDWTDTAWEDDHPDGKTVRATIADMMKLASPETEIPAQDLESVGIDPESHERMMRADTQYPLLVLQYPDGEYRVLDGNHRLGKALHTKQPSVQARVIKHQSLPKEWQWLFRQN